LRNQVKYKIMSREDYALTNELVKKPEQELVVTESETVRPEDNLTLEQAKLSETRDQESSKLDAESGLDHQVVEEISRSFELYENEADVALKGNISFKVRGHQIRIWFPNMLPMDWRLGAIMVLSIDGTPVNDFNAKDKFSSKYSKVVEALSALGNEALRDLTFQKAINEVLG